MHALVYIALKESTGTLLYDVRWDDGHESIFCPGATAHFVRFRNEHASRGEPSERAHG
jgi:hypothetical protein